MEIHAKLKSTKFSRIFSYILFFIAMWIIALFFHHWAGANPMSRLATVFSLVEKGSFEAHEWLNRTPDKSIIGGKFYGDKAPFSSFLVLPFYWLWRLPSNLPQTEHDIVVATHMGNFVAAAVPFSILFFLIWKRLQKNDNLNGWKATTITFLAAFGTFLFPYGHFFWGHLLAAILFLGGYIFAVERKEKFVLAGLFGGLSVLTEYPMAISQICIAIYLLVQRKNKECIQYCIGALPSAIAMFGYNKIITGRFLDFPYSHVSDAFKPMQKAFGVSLPDPLAIWELIFGQYRGLLFYAPIMLVLIPWMISRRFFTTPKGKLVAIFCIVEILFVSSYFKWDGGWCIGPRHLTPMMVLLCYEGIPFIKWSAIQQYLFTTLSCIGIVINLFFAATVPAPPENMQHPFFEFALVEFRKGHINPHNLITELLDIPPQKYFVTIWVILFVVLVALVAYLTPKRKQCE